MNFDLLVTNSFTQKHSDFVISLSKLESAFVKESFDVFKLSIVIVLIFDFFVESFAKFGGTSLNTLE